MKKQPEASTGTVVKLPPDIVPVVRAMAKSERRSLSSMTVVLLAFAINGYKEAKVKEVAL